jgi:hypothetical protein
MGRSGKRTPPTHGSAPPGPRAVPDQACPKHSPPAPASVPPPPRGHSGLLLALAFLSAAIFLAPVLSSGDCFWGSGTDIQSYQYPHRDFAFRWLRRGIWPLWNPYIFNGVPYQTGVHSLAYPGTILGLIFSTAWEIKLTLFIHLALALFFMAALLRSLRYSLLAAYLGGMVYALSGFAASHLYAGHVDMITTYAFAPLVLWSSECALRRRGAGWTILAGLALALMIISGHYQIVYLALFGVGLLTLVRVLLGASHAVGHLGWSAPWERGENNRDARTDLAGERREFRLLARSPVPVRERGRDLCWWLVRVGLSAGVAGLVSFFQMLPTEQSMQLSNRFRGDDYVFAVSNGVPKLNWLTYLVPGIFGGTERTPFWPSWSAWEGQAYLGLATLFLVLLAVALGTRRHWLPLLIVALVGTALAMGEHAPFFRLYLAIDPLVGRFRAPSRFVLPVTMMAAWLSAQGLELARRHVGPVPWRRLALLFGPVLSVLGGGWLWLVAADGSPSSSWGALVKAAAGPQRWEEILARRSNLVSEALRHARSQTAWALAMAGVAVALLVWLLRAGGKAGPASGGAGAGLRGDALSGPVRRLVPALLLVLLVGIDLLVFAQPYLITRELGRFGLPPETETFLEQHVGTARMLSAPQLRALNWGESRGLSHFGGYDTIVSDRYNRAVNLAMGYEADRQVMVMNAFDYGPWWQVQGVRFLLSPYDLTGMSDRLQHSFAGFRPLGRPGGVYVYENSDAFPRAFAVHGLYPARSAEEALAVVTTRAELLRSQAVVSVADQAVLNPQLPLGRDTAADQVTIDSLTPNEVLITARLQAPGLVVLTDLPWPGWRVEVDGAGARLWSVNAALHRAVLVPAGSHRVRFRYFPPALRWGLVVSFSTLALILAYLAGGRFAAKSGAGAPTDHLLHRGRPDRRIDIQGAPDHDRPA